ncbi:hypothetical protein EYZ11_010643 [Aspergillus tanneri]|uniref:Uncharacterized protein n=1 Tax=Aspergillus tanneri TaxID=1220188 RepID=A0A4S3J5C8_9EURO|nr:hypothetical protein EYZ11_010643 [Aspergillus tanneri]
MPARESVPKHCPWKREPPASPKHTRSRAPQRTLEPFCLLQFNVERPWIYLFANTTPYLSEVK